MALFFPAYEAWLAEREGEGDLIQRIMLFNLFWSIGMTLGPAFTSYLYGEVQTRSDLSISPVFSRVILTLVTIWCISYRQIRPIKSIRPRHMTKSDLGTA